jgi:hypothetical protein
MGDAGTHRDRTDATISALITPQLRLASYSERGPEGLNNSQHTLTEFVNEWGIHCWCMGVVRIVHNSLNFRMLRFVSSPQVQERYHVVG